MRAIDQLLHTRTRVRQRYALMPLEGFPPSRLPPWENCEARVLAAPALGARFAEYRIDLQPGGGTKQAADDGVETFLYVLSGGVTLRIDQDASSLTEGGYALVPHTSAFALDTTVPSSLLVVRKSYERAAGIAPPRPVVGNQAQVEPQPYLGNASTRLQVLLPDELSYDLAMNIFTFDPGHSLPVVETHVMEHGLYFLQGKGVYFLGDAWMEVEATDFIWMAPFCPQSFYATGAQPARYIYYKNVNREIAL
jgi:(S)-ureidoglycine aminohydrolase